VPALRRRAVVTDGELVAVGLAVCTTRGAQGDVFSDQLVLAITDTADRIIGFTAHRKPEVDGDQSVAKYLSTSTSSGCSCCGTTA
jgi:thiazolylpeptide-type bacteriocin precursor